jgi:transcription termination factor Rho
MTVLHRDALEASPLADLHAIASELGLDGYRRLRKADLIERILEREGGNGDAAEDDAETVATEVVDEAAEEEGARPRRRRGSRGGRGRTNRDEEEPSEERRDAVVEGVVELLGNGSGFVRLTPP